MYSWTETDLLNAPKQALLPCLLLSEALQRNFCRKAPLCLAQRTERGREPLCGARREQRVRAHLLEELVRSRRSGCVARSGLLLRLGPVGPFRSRCTTTLRARSRRVRLEVREPMLERERMGDLPCWSSVVLFRAWLGTAGHEGAACCWRPNLVHI